MYPQSTYSQLCLGEIHCAIVKLKTYVVYIYTCLYILLRIYKTYYTIYMRTYYYILLLGEIHCQAGDAVTAIQIFSAVTHFDPDNPSPIPYLNAARVYQQLNQHEQAVMHMKIAYSLDPSLAMTRVDLAQHYLGLGQTSDALCTLQGALHLSRQVSEVKDVLTAREVALLQLELQGEGLQLFAMTV